MASIKLKGDTSGEVIISAPSVAGASTLELQATNGTIATTTEVDALYNHLGSRNLIINGNMQVSQRGTTFSPSGGAGFFTLDRWRYFITTGCTGNATITQSDVYPQNTPFRQSIKITPDATETPTGSGNILFQQNFEGQNVQVLQHGSPNPPKATVSFWVKSNKTGTYCVQIREEGVTSESYLLYEYTIDNVDTWEKKVITWTGNTAHTLNNNTAEGFRIIWHLACGSDDHAPATTTWTDNTLFLATSNQVNFFDSTSNEWYMTGVQFEVGDTATPFENVPYDLTLQKCMRYYQRFAGGAAFTSGINGVYNDTVNIVALHQHIVPFRATPTFSYSALSHFDLEPFDTQPTVLTANAAGNLYQASVTGRDPTGRVRGYGGTITCDNGAGYFDFSAEL
jgi:hypothetical protein